MRLWRSITMFRCYNRSECVVKARNFKEATNVTGIVLTKLDGTAKGGIVLVIRNELHIPVKYAGLGEQIR